MENAQEILEYLCNYMRNELIKAAILGTVAGLTVYKVKNDWIGFFEDIKKLIEFILKVILFLPRIIKKKMKRRRAWKNS